MSLRTAVVLSLRSVDVTRVAAPLTEHQAVLIRPLGLLADDPDGLRRVWASVEAAWSATIEHAATLPPGLLDERVGDGWSLLEHLRHLVFVSDAWVGMMILEEPAPYDPVGLPPHFVTNGAELGLDLDAHPSFDEVVAARNRAATRIGTLLTGLDPAELDHACTPLDGQFTVLGALQNVVFEEWAHHRYAIRDLAVLTKGE
jgi:DinB superfamily